MNRRTILPVRPVAVKLLPLSPIAFPGPLYGGQPFRRKPRVGVGPRYATDRETRGGSRQKRRPDLRPNRARRPVLTAHAHTLGRLKGWKRPRGKLRGGSLTPDYDPRPGIRKPLGRFRRRRCATEAVRGNPLVPRSLDRGSRLGYPHAVGRARPTAESPAAPRAAKVPVIARSDSRSLEDFGTLRGAHRPGVFLTHELRTGTSSLYIERRHSCDG